MTYKTGAPFSDSVNLGSNPSPPATRNTDKTGVSSVSGASDNPEYREQNAHTGRTIVGTVADIPDNDLLRRAVRNCRRIGRGRTRVPLWSVVSSMFALGSGYSVQLCRRFDLDPEEMVKHL